MDRYCDYGGRRDALGDRAGGDGSGGWIDGEDGGVGHGGCVACVRDVFVTVCEY